MSEQEAPVFSIEKLYVKDLSVEVPHAPAIFLEQNAPEITIQMQSGAEALNEEVFEVVLTVTATARIGEQTAFLVEAAQAGIFRVRNVPQEDMNPLLSIGCPNILFPYVREVISDAVIRAGFAPVILQPVNFETLYFQRLEQERAAAAAQTPQ
ncbi:protein-export chaperone SecB [Rhodocyclus purpureus]|uniref:protein-export chaperone SecB n=1 Tax=Rhodocyclus purpureus TaxID=1067 RepID=UPI001911DB7B|nr:protein-export chaperone SecB [Rhodocyclus purpureus]MBK5913612.1 protein-export chaperone SecB [Rhodocyclus purpureus]